MAILTKNVISQIFQRPYIFISILEPPNQSESLLQQLQLRGQPLLHPLDYLLLLKKLLELVETGNLGCHIAKSCIIMKKGLKMQ